MNADQPLNTAPPSPCPERSPRPRPILT